MPAYLTPGVYFERADTVVPAITALRTDIAAFVGIAERGPLHTAVPTQSWRQFQAHFGHFIAGGYLAYSVKAFFENGGRKCHVVRVADAHAATSAHVVLADGTGHPAWIIRASSPGVWGSQLAIQLRATHRAQTQSVAGPGLPDRTATRVRSIAHFERHTLVRLVPSGGVFAPILRIAAAVDGEDGTLRWRDPLPMSLPLSTPVFLESIEYTLTVFWRGRVAAIYEGLSLVPENPRYAPGVVALPALNRSDTRTDILPVPPPLVIVERQISPAQRFTPPLILNGLVVESDAPIPLTGGADGLATLSVGDFIGEPEDFLESDLAKSSKRRGIRALEVIDEVSLVAVPDIHIQPAPPPRTAPLPPPEHNVCLGVIEQPVATNMPQGTPEVPPEFSEREIYQVQAALVAHCEAQRDRFALLDPPFAAAREDALGVGAILAWRSRFESKYAALYYPWLRVLDPLRSGGQVVRALPPSGHIAGLMARTDLNIGVHKAPANAELEWAEDTTAAVDEAMQAGLNPRGINAIRVFPGRGLLLYGARTVSSDPDWRYVNVRRLLMMIEEALEVATQWVPFEPNDTYTRGKVHLAISSFLETLWRRGALAGAHPEQAFFVRCDEENNPSAERDQGRLRVDLGVAPSIPYEFVLLRVGRTADELEISELT